MRTLLLIASTLLMRHAAAASQHFSCGGADVAIDIITRESATWELRAEAVVTVSRDGYSTILRYRGNTDFIGGTCVTASDSSPLILYQAFCGGSACKDLDNWGVIDPKTLRVLVVPGDSNRREVAMLLGNQPLPDLEVMSIKTDAQELGR